MEGQDMTASKPKKKLSVKEKIRRGPAAETIPVWVGADLDLVREYERLEGELIAVHKDSDSLAGPEVTAEVKRARMQELADELADYVVEFRLNPIGPKQWAKLMAKHPPRQTAEGQTDPRDRVGWNMTTCPGAMVRAATVAPDFDDDDWLVLLGDDDTDGNLTDGQIDELSAAVLRLSQHHINIPFSRAASTTSRNSASE